jgi:sugar (pentulose or hexulose) kinase
MHPSVICNPQFYNPPSAIRNPQSAIRERESIMRILALDIGSSSVKAGILDVETAQPVYPLPPSAPYKLEHPNQDTAQVRAEAVWEAVCRAARGAVEGHAEEVEGIGLTCLMPALVLLDARDNVLGPVWTHLDRRARPVSRRIWEEMGIEFLSITGNRPLPGGMSVTCFVKQTEEDASLRDRVAWYLHLHGWLAFRLTGERACDPANASFTGLFGTLTDRQWSSYLADCFGVDLSWLPPVVSGDETLGQLLPEVAQAFGLPPGLPVKLGTADTSSAMLAAGMTGRDLIHSVGTTQVLAAFATPPRPDPRRLVRHLGVRNDILHVTQNPVGGVAIGWLHSLCFQDQTEEQFYQHTVPEVLARLETEEPEPLLDPPFLGGDRLEIEPVRASFRELTLATNRLDLLGALLAGMRRRHQEAVNALGLGSHFERIFLTGGGADFIRELIPAYDKANLCLIEDGALGGVAVLFQSRAEPRPTAPG